MRVNANLTAQDLSLSAAPQGGERYVYLGHYVPIETKLTSYFIRSRFARSLDYIKGLIRGLGAPSNLDAARIHPALRIAIERGPARFSPIRRTSGARKSSAGKPQPAQTRAAPFPKPALQAVSKVQAAIDATQTPGEAQQIWNGFADDGAMTPVQAALDGWWKRYGFANLTLKISHAVRDLTVPVGAPELTSELGLLMLDRTAIKRVGFKIGEPVYVLTLGPGEETTLEKRVNQKSSLSFEEAFERDVETKLEADTERSETTTTSETLTDSEKSSRNTTIDSDLQLPGGSIPVNGKIGLHQSDQFDKATDATNQQSRNIAVRATQRISSSLRAQHKTTFKESRETTLETLTRRVIRNPNPEGAIDLVYFKILEQLDLQQERTGIRLCWAPFISDPGCRVRQRMAMAYQQVIDDALGRLSLPQPPMPPTPETKTLWVPSLRWPIMLGLFNDYGDVRDFYIPIRKTDTFTGNLRAGIDWNGDTPRGNATVVFAQSSTGVVEDDDELINQFGADFPIADYAGFVKVSVKVTIPQSFISGKSPDFYAEAEVLRAAPVFNEKLSAYLQVRQYYDQSVTVLKNQVIADAEPAALAAQSQVLESTDVRAELMHAVVTQYIAPAYRDSGKDIELWQRLIDFDNIGFELYPAWWRTEEPPDPQLPANHFINASWARVYLPVASDADRPAFLEKMFLNRLFEAASLNTADARVFNSLVGKFTTGLVEAQKKFMSADNWKKDKPVAVGDPWSVLVPTDGTHCEIVQSASNAFTILNERKSEAGVQLLEAQVAAVAADNALRGQVQTPIEGQVIVGNVPDY